MVLTVESKYTSPWATGVPYPLKDKASNFKFEIPSSMLSHPYSLKAGDTVKGIILKVENIEKKDYPGLKGEEVDFLLYPLLLTDYLFISKSNWEEKFREYGLVQYFFLSVRLEKAIMADGNEVPLYTKVDLKI